MTLMKRMAIFKRMTIFKRTIIWLIAITLVSFFLLGCIVWNVRETIRQNGLDHIQKILNHKMMLIDMYIDQRYNALNNLTQLFFFISHHHDIFNPVFWNSAPANLQESIADFSQNNDFYDIFLITVKGEIVFTVKHEKDLHTNILNGPYRDSQLARVFNDALQNTGPHISDFYYYEPSQDYAAFIAKPIIHNGKIIGVTAVQVDNKAIYRAVNDYSELGKTGKIIASVFRDGQLMSMIPIRNSTIKPYTFLDSPNNTAVSNAAYGGTGQKYRVDRLGHDVAVAWNYQKDLHWGLSVQIDESELLASWYQESLFLMVLFFSGVFIVGIMVITAFRSFAQPIHELTENALLMLDGNYDICIDSKKYDFEWQLLLRVFQKMAIEINYKITQLNQQNHLLIRQKEEIEKLNQNLEKKIETKSKKLREYVDIIDRYVLTSQTDRDGIITYVSEAFCKISGYTKEQMIGQTHRILRHQDMADDVYANLWSTIASGEIWHGEIKNRKADGTYYWIDMIISPSLDNGEIIGYTAIRHDITNQKIIEELSITDSLTGLYNRRHYGNIIQAEINRVKRHGMSLALMMMDVDNFKLYNDTYGHQAGDTVLIQVANVLKSHTARSGDYAFRLGGEEFGVVVGEMIEEEYVALAENIRNAIEALALPHKKNTVADCVTISIGIAVFCSDSQMTSDDLYREADKQLYRSKESGRNQVKIKSCVLD